MGVTMTYFPCKSEMSDAGKQLHDIMMEECDMVSYSKDRQSDYNSILNEYYMKDLFKIKHLDDGIIQLLEILRWEYESRVDKESEIDRLEEDIYDKDVEIDDLTSQLESPTELSGILSPIGDCKLSMIDVIHLSDAIKECCIKYNIGNSMKWAVV